MGLDEHVLIIPTQQFRSAGYFHGFRRADETFRASILQPSSFSFRPRSVVETDPEFKQLIPYVLLRSGDELFHYRRGASGTEKRLGALRSVGIGGHISVADAAGDGDPYRNGMLRELGEEIAIGCEYEEHFLGFINDDRTPVGSVHLGVVHLFELAGPRVQAREEAIADSGFAPLKTLFGQIGEFETWSQFVLADLIATTS